jgi:ATP-binding cassette subfamily C (CFTR/MRP) protein 1
MGRGLPWWLALATTERSPSPSSGSLADSLAFLFLSPCPQRALLGALDLLFLLVTFVLALLTRRNVTTVNAVAPEQEPLLPAPNPQLRSTTGRFAVGLSASAVLAATSAVLLALVVLLLPAERVSLRSIYVI